MPSSKNSRRPPQRRFEDYTLNRIISPESGLYPISIQAMQNVPGPAGDAGRDDATSNYMDIGFDFEFEGLTYKQIVVSSNGYAILVDPRRQGSTSSDGFAAAYACFSTWYNNATMLAPFNYYGRDDSYNVLLCAWADDLRNVYDDMTESRAQMYTPASLNEQRRIQYGLAATTGYYNQARGGVKYARVTCPDGSQAIVFRWTSMSNYANPSSILKFDVVIYQNGVIEFRYATTSSIRTALLGVESATIGVFLNNAPGSYWRFRDFTHGFGYDDFKRSAYHLGGAVYSPTYTDTDYYSITKPYTISITPDKHWPGLASTGCVMRFSPPLNRRRVLPRTSLRTSDSRVKLPLSARTGDQDRLGNKLISFDDRRSLSFISGVVVDYPTTIPRKYADSEPGSPDRLDLFGNMSITGSIVKGNATQFIGLESKQFVSPFSEANRPEQSSTDSYYVSGSSIDLFGTDLSMPLRSKTQLHIELPVENPTMMFDVTSSIYYYNTRMRGWFVPRNTEKGSTTKSYDLANPLYYAKNDYFADDARGFGAFGNPIMSATKSDGSVSGDFGMDAYTFQFRRMPVLMSMEGLNSVPNKAEYVANSDEQFALPINQPFLIEKVVFELPITAGDGWFNSRTTSGFTHFYTGGGLNPAGQCFDVAGPAITVALYNQQRSGPNEYSRDLITSGTIIPIGDNYGNVKAAKFPEDFGSVYAFSPEGFPSYNQTPAAVLSPNRDNNSFTGSVSVPTVAGISNGVIVAIDVHTFGAAAARAQALRKLTSPTIDVNSLAEAAMTGTDYTNIWVKDVNTFGRAFKGFPPSGRSVFGKEFVTMQNSVTAEGTFKNPLYVSSSFNQLPAHMSAALNDPGFNLHAYTACNIGASFPSPYLVLPGDRLTLAISKMRPLLLTRDGRELITGTQNDSWFSGSKHDVTLNTGSIKVTIYGSMLNQGREHHDPLNQYLSSDAVHDVIGNEPVCDQYDVEYRKSFWDTYTDEYITGSLISVISSGGRSYFRTGSRGKVFSNVNAELQPAPASTPTTSYEVITNPSKAYRYQPWYEKTSKTLRHVKLTSIAERFWDSMVPNLSDCLTLGGASIWIDSVTGYKVFTDPKMILGKTTGYMFFNFQTPLFSDNLKPITNGVWTWSFPFEPRYANVSRDASFVRGLVAKQMYDSNLSVMIPIAPQPITTFYPIFYGHQYLPSYPSQPYMTSWQMPADVDLRSSSPYYMTGSMSPDDLVRVMYGFGDANTVTPQDYDCLTSDPDYTKGTYGWNHMPEFRAKDITTTAYWSISPVIRGWRYGLYNGLPVNSDAVFRRDTYGQFRDMLEQRPYTKYYQTIDTAESKMGTVQGPITVTFVDTAGKITQPENTWSQNLSMEATSSLPYFDGVARNRPTINSNTLNQHIVTLKSNIFNNVTI